MALQDECEFLKVFLSWQHYNPAIHCNKFELPSDTYSPDVFFSVNVNKIWSFWFHRSVCQLIWKTVFQTFYKYLPLFHCCSFIPLCSCWHNAKEIEQHWRCSRVICGCVDVNFTYLLPYRGWNCSLMSNCALISSAQSNSHFLIIIPTWKNIN